MTPSERQYLRSLYYWFTDKYNSRQIESMSEFINDLKIYHEGIFEVLSLEGKEYDEDDLIELFIEHKIPFL